VICCGITICWLVLLTGSGLADTPAAPGQPPAAPAAAAPKYLGVVTCARCHREPSPEDLAGTTDYVHLTEYATWNTQDKHRIAYEVLTGERAKAMEERLSRPGQPFVATAEASCLNCHALDVQSQPCEATFTVERGVSCEVCHGPASNWLAPHAVAGWRTKTDDDKANLGMYPVRDPVRRTELCLSCHLGSTSENKVVTHAMYAAGHPPLPGFEVETFARIMPKHWRHLSEKPETIQEQFHYQPQGMFQTRQVVVGGVAAMLQEMQMLAGHERMAGNGWPELSFYDCSSCHHDLKVDSWRQKRGYPITAGRPMIRTWPLALVQLGLSESAAGDGEKLEEILDPVYKALDRQPFGDATELASAATSVAAQLQTVLERVGETEFDDAKATGLLRKLCRMGIEKTPDYDAARQLSWAFEVIYGELAPKPAADAQIRQTLAELDASLNLNLSPGQETPVADSLAAAMRVASGYDPEAFRKHFGTLSQLLGPAE
jgi:hypothetical protein